MNKNTVIFVVFVCAVGSASIARAHGTEREFGTETDDRNRMQLAVASGGSPAFTLLVIESNSRAILRAAAEGLAAVVQKRALRLPQLANQLRRRSKKLAARDCPRATHESSAVADSVLRVSSAARVADTAALQHEIGVLLQHVASYSRFLKENSVDGEASTCQLD